MGEALDMCVDKDVLKDQELTGGHSQYVSPALNGERT